MQQSAAVKDQAIAKLRAERGSQAAQKQIEASGEKLQDVAKVLDLVTDAVSLASRLVILAAA